MNGLAVQERPKPALAFNARRAGFLAVLIALAAFAGGEGMKLFSFISHMKGGDPFIYMHGEPHWLIVLLLAVAAVLSFFGPKDSALAARRTGLWIAGLAGLPLLLLLTPLLLGGGTIVTEEISKRYGYEACFWRAGAGSLRGDYLSWEVFYVPRDSECLRLENYSKEKFFAGIASQSALAGKRRIPVSSR